MLRFFTTLEKVLVVVLVVIIGWTSYYLYGRYIREHSDLIASDGGVYTEGVVGRPGFINPVLLTGNQVDRDLAQLVFSGLTKYNPHTGKIEDDIATHERSSDDLTYTFTIVPDARWHDGEPVTADDVVYTYETVLQDEAFVNASLRQTFSDVTVKKIDERTVSFDLDEPNSFFLANVTIGILPRHQLEFVPVDNLDKSEFNQSPIGSGPYQFVSWNVFNDVHEITFRRFDEYYGALPKIQTVIVRAFPDQPSLLLAENTLSGFRLLNSQKPEDLFGATSRFASFPYHLPQYSALFLNTQSDILSNRKVRFALLLATDKEKIAQLAGDAEVVDTPVLESKDDLDIEFSLERAMGAFFDTEWNLPSKAKALLDEAEEADASGGPVDYSQIQDAAELQFSFTAQQDTWLSLTVDGVPQSSFLFSQGDKKELTAKDSITFTTVGNAAGLSGSVNGISFRSFGESGVVLRGIVLSRATLSQYLVENQDSPTEQTPDESNEPAEPDQVEPPKEDEEPVEEEEAVPEEQEPVVAPELDETEKVRINDDGDRLILRLVTAQEPEVFLKVAEEVQKQWLEAGAKVVIESYSLPELQKKIQDRDYDVLLFGQNLGYNLDAFPFWHSSQAESGLNLSDYRSLEADNLLVDIRKTFDERSKQALLDRLKTVIATDTPAVFLYNPTHYYVVDRTVRNVELANLSNHSDRLTDLLNWYVKEKYELKDAFSFSELLRWMFSF